MEVINAHSESANTVGVEVHRTPAGTRSLFVSRLAQFFKFCVVGGTGVVVDMAVLYLLADRTTLEINITASKLFAAEAAMANNFLWNEVWTFRQGGKITKKHEGWLIRLVKFNIICGLGISLAVLLLHVFHSWLGWNLYLSNFSAIALTTLWNFGMNVKFNWLEIRPRN